MAHGQGTVSITRFLHGRAGTLSLNDDEVKALRKYLLNGGFLWSMIFGARRVAGMAEELKRFFPTAMGRFAADHPLYHCVFDIKSKAQILALAFGREAMSPGKDTMRTKRITV